MWWRCRDGKVVRGRFYAVPAALAVALALALAVALALVFGAGGVGRTKDYPDPVPLRMSGLLGNGVSIHAVSPEEARGASYLPGSNVPTPSQWRPAIPAAGRGRTRYRFTGRPGCAEGRRRVPAPGLGKGVVPGATEKERRIAERALLDLRLLTDPNGAAVAAPYKRWNYVWPRDASWAAAAFAATGHHEESYEILEFLASVQNEDGTWEARYRVDGTPVLDGRAPQLDATGWFPLGRLVSCLHGARSFRAAG